VEDVPAVTPVAAVSGNAPPPVAAADGGAVTTVRVDAGMILFPGSISPDNKSLPLFELCAFGCTCLPSSYPSAE